MGLFTRCNMIGPRNDTLSQTGIGVRIREPRQAQTLKSRADVHVFPFDRPTLTRFSPDPSLLLAVTSSDAG